MGQIVRTEAVVLRRIPFRETSQIVTLFTREMGKITVLAKGSRKPKSQFGGTLQPMAHIQAIFYYKPTRDLQTLSETAHLSVLNKISDDLDKIAVGIRMIELVQALMQQEEANPYVFDLLVASLRQLDRAEGHAINIWMFFQLRISGSLGFQPDVQRKEVEELSDAGGALLLDSGAIRSSAVNAQTEAPHETGTSPAVAASRTALRAFAILARAELEVICRLNLKPAILVEVGNLVDRYLKFHFEDALPTRSDRVIGQLKI